MPNMMHLPSRILRSLSQRGGSGRGTASLGGERLVCTGDVWENARGSWSREEWCFESGKVGRRT